MMQSTVLDLEIKDNPGIRFADDSGDPFNTPILSVDAAKDKQNLRPCAESAPPVST